MLIVSVFYGMRRCIDLSYINHVWNALKIWFHQKIKLRATTYFSQDSKRSSNEQKGQVTLNKPILQDMKTYFYFLYYSSFEATWTYFSTCFTIASRWRNSDILQASIMEQIPRLWILVEVVHQLVMVEKHEQMSNPTDLPFCHLF